MNLDADKFKGKYRIPSARLRSWDYGGNAIYFITICVKDRAFFFGDVVEGCMKVSALGEAAEMCWRDIPNHFPFVLLDEFVVMPNHVHGIVIFDKPEVSTLTQIVAEGSVETQNLASLRPDRDGFDHPPQNPASLRPAGNRFGPQTKNLASVIRGFKIGVTNFARRADIPFAWQPRFYDHVARNFAELERIRKYIRENPQNWASDQLND